MKKERRLAGTGLLAALASSLCCITPALALMAGTSGMASSFSWLEPLRPYLIWLTVAVLAYAWYQKLKRPVAIDCNCEINPKTNFMQTRKFLSLVTAFAFLMLTFPSYAYVFYTASETQTAQVNQEKGKTQTVEFKITGMTCDACTHHVASEVNKLVGITGLKVSYPNANAIVEFDKSKTSIAQLEKAIRSTGYKITETKVKK